VTFQKANHFAPAHAGLQDMASKTAQDQDHQLNIAARVFKNDWI